MALDEISIFTNESNELIQKSQYSEKIKFLLDRIYLGTSPHDYSNKDPTLRQPPNCFGTLFYVLGIIDEPRFVDRKFFEHFVDSNCDIEKEKDGLIVFLSKEKSINHCGIYLGQAAKKDAIFHQPNTGEEFTVLPYELIWRESLGIPYYLKIRDKNNIKLSPFFNV